MRVWTFPAAVVAVVMAQQAVQTNPPTEPKQPSPLKQGSLTYYKNHCSRCHGRLGGAYPEDFTKSKTEQELTQVIKSMAAGQGGSPLNNDQELAAQVALHYAIDLKRPFLDWTSLDGLKLSGEVTPGAKVVANVDGHELPVEVKQGVWTLTVGSEADIHRVKLTASVQEVVATLDLSKLSYAPQQSLTKS